MDQDEAWHGGRPRPGPHCVKWGPSSPPQRGTAPNLRPITVVAKWLDGLGMEVGLSPGDFVLDGDPAPLPKMGQSPQFLARVYCEHTAGWIKMPLRTEVGLGPGDIALEGDPAPP